MSEWRNRIHFGDCLATLQRMPAGIVILASTRQGDLVLDPFIGSGTTAQVAMQHGRAYLGCELNPAYKALQDERLRQPWLALEVA